MYHAPGFLSLVNSVRPRVKELSVDETQALMESGQEVRLIDVREDSEWENGHIPGAEHIGKGVIERDIETRIPDKSATVVLYCGGGYRSVLAADVLAQMGYTNVASMAGGWREWTGAGNPIETPAASSGIVTK
jgi:rhodanese-related sulfurtransferase